MATSFISPSSRTRDAYFYAGLASSFSNIIDSGGTRLSEMFACHPSKESSGLQRGCKVFRVARADTTSAIEVNLDDIEEGPAETDDVPVMGNLQDQVLVFRYKGKFHAVNNLCPHATYPLSNGTPFDIEDFGLALSSGLTCAKHGWSFDLYTGRGDRGNYKLGIWEVQLRPTKGPNIVISQEEGGVGSGDGDEATVVDEEVWVRRKQRIG